MLPVLMPYNRIIEPAGEVVTFGNPGSENHSLDVRLITGTKNVVVEDRAGMVLINTVNKAVIKRWTYSENASFKGMASTYSGIQVFNENDKTHILWSAVQTATHRSYVIWATWDGKKIAIKDTISFQPVSPSPLALPNEILIRNEQGKKMLYTVLNGNNQLVKTNLESQEVMYTSNTGVAPYGLSIVDDKVFVSNWGDNAG